CPQEPPLDKPRAPHPPSEPGRRGRYRQPSAQVMRGVLASSTVSAAILTMRRTVELDVRICTGALTPSRNGPTATLPPAAVFSKLYAMLPESTLGQISRLASPCR